MPDDEHEERIRARAYQIWEAEGRPHGREREHWDRAAREVGEELGDTSAGEPGGERDFGDSAGYGSGGSALDRHDVGAPDPEEDSKPNPLDKIIPTR